MTVYKSSVEEAFLCMLRHGTRLTLTGLQFHFCWKCAKASSLLSVTKRSINTSRSPAALRTWYTVFTKNERRRYRADVMIKHFMVSKCSLLHCTSAFRVL